MNIRKDDMVVVLSGKDKAKRGKVLHVDRADGRVLVEGVNLYRKHTRPKQQGEKGELVTLSRTIAASKLALVCRSCDRGARVGTRESRGGERERYCKRCKGTI